jgi:hypothetical protein
MMMMMMMQMHVPIIVAARSKARIVFARLNSEILGSNPTRGMAALRRTDSPTKEFYRQRISE